MWIQVLGPVRAESGSREANLGGPKQRTVFALLALRANRSVGVEELINEVWEDVPPGRPRKTLQVYIANLRRELADPLFTDRTERITSGAFGYQLTARPDELDLRRWDALLTQARDRSEDAPGAAIAAYESALALWRSARPLSDLLTNAAVTRLIRPLEESRGDAIEALMGLRIKHGSAHAVVAALPDLIAADPWRERLWGLLMEAYYVTGRQIDALETYQRVRTLMIDELGVEPGPELRQLERRILAQDPTLATTPPAVEVAAPASDERRTGTFVSFGLADHDDLLVTLDPEDLAELVDDLRRRVGVVVAEHGGRVVSTSEEGVLASFGYPSADEDDPQRAVRAALAVCAGDATSGATSGTASVAPAVTATGPPIDRPTASVGAGVHTGLALYRGSPPIPTGQAPAVAVRLQRAARAGEVLATSQTGGLVSATFGLAPPGRPIALPSELSAVVVSGELPPADAGVETVELVGRTEELARIRVLDAADDPALVVLRGEAGIGKTAMLTTLLAEFGRSAPGALAMRGERHRRSQALYPIGQLLATRYSGADELELELDLLGVPRPALAEVIAVLGDLAGWPGAQPPGVLSVTARRAAVTTWLASLGAARPLRLVVDDLPYLDAETVSVLEELVNELNHGLVVVTTREDELPPGLAARAEVIEIARLTESEARALVVAAAAPARLRLARVNEIATLADGHPLHLRELARQAAASPAGARAGDVPMTLQGSLLARLDRLGPDKGLVQRCAVIGDRFEVELASLVGDDGSEGRTPLRDRLDVLVSEGVLTRTGPADRPQYGFAEALLEDVAYASLPRAVRTELHQRIAARLSAADRPDAAQLAEHLEAAGQVSQAALGWLQAAEKALAGTRFAEGQTYARRALSDLAELPEGPERDRLTIGAKLLLSTAIKMTVIADAELEDHVLSAFALAEANGELALKARFYPILISTLQAIGRYDEAAQRGTEAVAVAAAIGNPAMERRVRQFHAATLIWMGRLEEADRIYVPVDESGPSYGPELSVLLRAAEVLSDCAGLALAGLAEVTRGRPDASDALFDRAMIRATESGASESICLVLATRAIARQLTGDVAGTHALAESTIELAVQLGNDWWFVWAQALLGWSVAADGNPTEGLALVQEAMEHAGNVRQLLPYFNTLAAEAELGAGHPDAALTRLHDAAAMAERTGERFFLPYIHLVTVRALAAAGASESEIELHRRIVADVAQAQGQRFFADQVAGAC